GSDGNVQKVGRPDQHRCIQTRFESAHRYCYRQIHRDQHIPQTAPRRPRTTDSHSAAANPISTVAMKDGLRASLKRLERLVQIKQTYVSVAEANVKQAEGEVRQLETAENEIAGNIQHTQAEIAYLQTATGHDVQ